MCEYVLHELQTFLKVNNNNSTLYCIFFTLGPLLCFWHIKVVLKLLFFVSRLKDGFHSISRKVTLLFRIGRLKKYPPTPAPPPKKGFVTQLSTEYTKKIHYKSLSENLLSLFLYILLQWRMFFHLMLNIKIITIFYVF